MQKFVVVLSLLLDPLFHTILLTMLQFPFSFSGMRGHKCDETSMEYQYRYFRRGNQKGYYNILVMQPDRRD